MKFTMNRIQLTNIIRDANRVKDLDTFDEFKCIKMIVSPNQIYIGKTNGELTFESTVIKSNYYNIRVEETGEFLVNGNFISKVIEKLSGDYIELSMNNGETLLKVKSSKAKFEVHTLPTKNYPKPSDNYDKQSFNINFDELNTLVKNTLYCASKDKSRPILTGVHFIAKKDIIKSVATDSLVFAQERINLEQPLVEDFDFIIPSDNLKQIIPLIKKTDSKQVRIGYNKNLSSVFFQTNTGLKITTRLLEGSYPNTDNIIKNIGTCSTTVKLNAKSLHDSLLRSSMTADSKSNQIATMNINKEEIVVSNDKSSLGSFKEPLSNAVFDGDDIQISFNPLKLIDGLKKMDQSEVELNFSSPLSPIFFFNAEDRINVKNDAVRSNVNLISPVRA